MIVPVGLVQMRCGDDRDANLAKAAARVEEAARRGARIVCLQELFRSPYPCQSEDPARFDWAEPFAGGARPPARHLAARVAARLSLAAPIL